MRQGFGGFQHVEMEDTVLKYGESLGDHRSMLCYWALN